MVLSSQQDLLRKFMVSATDIVKYFSDLVFKVAVSVLISDGIVLLTLLRISSP